MTTPRTSYHHISLIREEVVRFLHSQWVMIGVSIGLTGLLTFFLIILVWMGGYIHAITQSMQDKLGIYLYIKDTTSTAQIMDLTNTLKTNGIASTYFSKDDAAKKLNTKIPRIAQTLSTYKIANPLPATLSIRITSMDDYARIATIIPTYKSLFTDSSIADTSLGTKAQEQRIVHALDVGYFLRGFVYALITLFVLIVMTGYLYTIHYKIAHSADTIDVKKYLGATYAQIRRPYYILASILLAGGTTLGLITALGTRLSMIGHDDVLVYIHQIVPLAGEIGQTSISRGGLWFVGLLMLCIWIIVGLGTVLMVHRRV